MLQNCPSPRRPPSGALGWWKRLPLYGQILLGLFVGVMIGSLMHPHWAGADSARWVQLMLGFLNAIVDIVLRLLRAIAAPLILLAVLRSVAGTKVRGKTIGRLIYFLTLNTTTAVLVALLVANVMHPGVWANLSPPARAETHAPDLSAQLLGNIPNSLLSPLVDNNVIGVILIAVAIGFAVRQLSLDNRMRILRGVDLGQSIIVILLRWVLYLVPLAVMCKVGAFLTTDGLAPFASLAWFVFAVLLALVIQTCYYLVRLKFGSWVTPLGLLRGARDALTMAFSTSSSIATMPVSYQCLTERVGVQRENAALGIFVGSNFNHDGTAVYEAMSALFVAQAIGLQLSLGQQFIVIVMSMLVSFGAAGIPEAGLVTMPLVFNAVGLPLEYVALLLPIDWLLDRCRTTVNVLGDMNVSCMLEGKTVRQVAEAPAGATEPPTSLDYSTA